MSQIYKSSTGGGSVDTQLTGNSGVAAAAAGNINVVTANATVKFVGSGSTLTQDFGLSNLALGSSLPSLTSGSDNVTVGNLAGASITNSSFNVIIGYLAGNLLSTGGANVILGTGACAESTNISSCVAIGSAALDSCVAGPNADTIAIGYASLGGVTTGTNNIAIGYESGQNYTSSESNNILIGHFGVVGESHVIRIGTQGSPNQLQTYIAGVINTLSGRVINITTPGAYPYTTLISDHMILVDTSSARTIIPLSSPVKGTLYYIKDKVGSAGVNNITITPSGKTIDGAASATISSPYGSVTIVYNGTEWSMI